MGHLADSSTPEKVSPRTLGQGSQIEVLLPKVSADEARSELAKILASNSLRDSEMLKSFLNYVVEQTLAGKADQLKEYRLGVDVFEREDSFDPRLDPVVRMAAGRLRKKLQEYYENAGQGDGLRIEVPKGGYAAHFVTVSARAADESDVQEQKVRQAADGATTTGRKWTLAATAVVLCAGLLAGGFYFRSRQGRRLTDKDTIVLADFANSTGDPVFDDTLKTALAISLQQSPFLNVLSEQKVSATLQAMTLTAGTKLTPEVARELCQRAGSESYIAGAIANLGNEYVLGLKAVNCGNGDTLAQQQVTAPSKEKVLNVLGEAASRLRAQLGESLATVQRFDVPLVEATTSSLEALKSYSLGAQALRENGPAAALPYAQRAIGLDPDFAMAYVEAGMDYSSLGEVDRAREYCTKAFELRAHASEREKLTIAALYYRNVTGELDKSVQTRQELVGSYPHESRAYISLGTDFASRGDYENAIKVTRRALQLNPDHVVSYDDLAGYLLATQRFDEARTIVHEAQARKLDNLLLHNALYALSFLARDAAGVADQDKWFAGRPEETYGLALSSDSEAYVGQMAKARELTKQAVDSAIRADSNETAAIWLENEALREAAYGYAAEARQKATSGLKIAPSSQGVEVEAALAFALAKDSARADSLTRDLNQRFPLDSQVQELWLPAVGAQSALDRNNITAAVKSIHNPSTNELGLIPFMNNISCLYPAYLRGEAYLATGDGTSAAVEFQKILDHDGIVWNCWTGALAHLGLARANALQSKGTHGADADAARVRALAAYKDFLTLWKDADVSIPVLRQARTEYAKLQ
ncbi:MAG TPA: tetratricopeptide repeat protein [Candidatus Dormibacteraeota bacterium]|jgi:tetratricopeptide (TPR) repeat protein|nr:tetratricopeptide repeat protein [Candidatus Dormibacteraeota bacterium]